MPEYLAPGVYVEEVEIGGKPIEGVSTSTVGFVGETERGPLGARLVTGLEQYRRLYGSQSWLTRDREGVKQSTSSLPYAIEGFFINAGKRCFVARVVGNNAAAAAADMPATATTPGPSPSPSPPPEPAPPAPPRPSGRSSPAIRVLAIGPGEAGNRIRVEVNDSSLGDRAPERFRLSVVYRDVNGREAFREEFDDLSPRHDAPNYFERRVNGASSLIRLERAPGAPGAGRPDNTPPPKANEPSGVALSGGRDGDALVLEDYQGRSDIPGNARGLGALGRSNEISILCAPDDQTVDGLGGAVVDQCEDLKDRFAIINARPEDCRAVEKLAPGYQAGGRSTPIDSKYAAFYAPPIKIVDGATGRLLTIPPGGHVAGI